MTDPGPHTPVSGQPVNEMGGHGGSPPRTGPVLILGWPRGPFGPPAQGPGSKPFLWLVPRLFPPPIPTPRVPGFLPANSTWPSPRVPGHQGVLGFFPRNPRAEGTIQWFQGTKHPWFFFKTQAPVSGRQSVSFFSKYPFLNVNLHGSVSLKAYCGYHLLPSHPSQAPGKWSQSPGLKSSPPLYPGSPGTGTWGCPPPRSCGIPGTGSSPAPIQ